MCGAKANHRQRGVEYGKNTTNEDGIDGHWTCTIPSADADEMIDDALPLEFDEVHGGLGDENIEMWDAGDGGDYMNDEEDDGEKATECSASVEGPCEQVSGVKSQMKTVKTRECPGRKRRIVKVTQWSASARANMVRALRERVT